MKIRTIALAAALAAAAMPAKAATMTAVDILNTYSLVVFGNLDSRSDIDGKSFVGGDVVGGTGNYNTHQVPAMPNASVPALTVGGSIKTGANVNGRGLVVHGDVTGNVNLNENGFGDGSMHVGGSVKGNVNANFNGSGSMTVGGAIKAGSNVNANGGSIQVGGKVEGGANVHANGGGKLTADAGSGVGAPDVASQAAQLKQTAQGYSKYLAGMDPDSKVTIAGSRATFTAVPGADGVAVFDVTNPAALFSASEFQFALNGASSIVINVSGALNGIVNIGANFLGGMAQILGKEAIWNFTDATSINISRQFGGSIIAMLANINNQSSIEGSVIAKSVVNGGGIHYDGAISNVVATPIPASLPLFAAGIIGLAAWPRLKGRRRA